MTLINRSISNRSDSSSSQSYSVSTLGSASTYYKKKMKNSLVVSHSGRENATLKKGLLTVKKRMRKCKSSHDRMSMSWSLHISNSDLRNAQFRLGMGVGMDQHRQLSISRWMADNEHCGKIRRTVSSHEALSTSHEIHRNNIPQSQVCLKHGQIQTNFLATPTQTRNKNKNAPFRLFQKQASQRTLSKPVRKRSSGPEGILQEMLMTLSGHEHEHGHSKPDPWKISNSTSTCSSNHTEEIANLNDDIEIEDSVVEDIDSTVEFHDDDDDDDNEDNEDTNSTTPLLDSYDTTRQIQTSSSPLQNKYKQPSLETVLSQKASRWDALSPSRNSQEKSARPLNKLLIRASSSKQMPILPPPPPPFSPSKPPREAPREAPREGGTIPCKPLRATSNHLLESKIAQHPAAAALAIAMDIEDSFSDNEEEEEEEEVQLNDVVTAAQKYCCSSTDAATANSNSGSSNCWGDDYSEDISVDGVSMLSVSVSNTTFTTLPGTNHSAAANGSLAAYMKWAKANQAHQLLPNANASANAQQSLSCKSFAEDTFAADTFAADTFAAESVDTTNSPREVALEPHPEMAPSKREASIVPPCMPKRSVSNHEKLDLAPRTPKSKRRSRSPSVNEAFRVVSSPTGGRVQKLLDAASKPKLTASRLGLSSTPNQRFRRRVTMDHTYSAAPTTTHDPEPPPSFVRRRASLDHSLLEPSRQRNFPQQPPTCGSSPKQQRQTALTSTITKTPRTSPSLTMNRKRFNSHDDAIGVDVDLL